MRNLFDDGSKCNPSTMFANVTFSYVLCNIFVMTLIKKTSKKFHILLEPKWHKGIQRFFLTSKRHLCSSGKTVIAMHFSPWVHKRLNLGREKNWSGNSQNLIVYNGQIQVKISLFYQHQKFHFFVNAFENFWWNGIS